MGSNRWFCCDSIEVSVARSSRFPGVLRRQVSGRRLFSFAELQRDVLRHAQLMHSVLNEKRAEPLSSRDWPHSICGGDLTGAQEKCRLHPSGNRRGASRLVQKYAAGGSIQLKARKRV